MPATPVTVVIPAFNCASVIARQLAALELEAAANDIEVVVADNGSTDDLRGVIERFSGRFDVRIVDASAGPRAGFARNVGAAAGTGDLLLFVDADDEVAPGYVGAMTSALADADIVGALLDVDALNDAATLGRDVPQVVGLPTGLYPWSYSCAIGVRRGLFERIGGFEELLWTGEDIDFCWRAQMAGGRMALADRAVVRYRVPNDLGSLFRQGCKYGRGGNQIERRYTSEGLEWTTLRSLITQTFKLAVRLVIAHDRGTRASTTFLLGRRIGYLIDRVRPLPIDPVRSDGRRDGWRVG